MGRGDSLSSYLARDSVFCHSQYFEKNEIDARFDAQLAYVIDTIILWNEFIE